MFYMCYLLQVVFLRMLQQSWWWEILSWVTSECLSSSFLLVKIKSMHDAFSYFKQVGLFIKHSRLEAFIKISIFLLSVLTLKSPLSIHYVESVQMQSFFWSVFSCIRTECRKKRTRKNSVHFSHSDSFIILAS